MGDGATNNPNLLINNEEGVTVFNVDSSSGNIATFGNQLDDGNSNAAFNGESYFNVNIASNGTGIGLTSAAIAASGVSGSGAITLNSTDSSSNIILNSAYSFTTYGAIAFGGASVPSGGSNPAFEFVTAGGNVIIASNATGTITVSDENKKKNIQDSNLSLSFINSLKPKMFNMKSDPDTEPLTHGLIFQDVKELHPQFGGLYENGENKGLNYCSFIAPLIASAQELSKQNDELKNDIKLLKKMFGDLIQK